MKGLQGEGRDGGRADRVRGAARCRGEGRRGEGGVKGYQGERLGWGEGPVKGDRGGTGVGGRSEDATG